MDGQCQGASDRVAVDGARQQTPAVPTLGSGGSACPRRRGKQSLMCGGLLRRRREAQLLSHTASKPLDPG